MARLITITEGEYLRPYDATEELKLLDNHVTTILIRGLKKATPKNPATTPTPREEPNPYKDTVNPGKAGRVTHEQPILNQGDGWTDLKRLQREPLDLAQEAWACLMTRMKDRHISVVTDSLIWWAVKTAAYKLQYDISGITRPHARAIAAPTIVDVDVTPLGVDWVQDFEDHLDGEDRAAILLSLMEEPERLIIAKRMINVALTEEEEETLSAIQSKVNAYYEEERNQLAQQRGRIAIENAIRAIVRQYAPKSSMYKRDDVRIPGPVEYDLPEKNPFTGEFELKRSIDGLIVSSDAHENATPDRLPGARPKSPGSYKWRKVYTGTVPPELDENEVREYVNEHGKWKSIYIAASIPRTTNFDSDERNERTFEERPDMNAASTHTLTPRKGI